MNQGLGLSVKGPRGSYMDPEGTRWELHAEIMRGLHKDRLERLKGDSPLWLCIQSYISWLLPLGLVVFGNCQCYEPFKYAGSSCHIGVPKMRGLFLGSCKTAVY